MGLSRLAVFCACLSQAMAQADIVLVQQARSISADGSSGPVSSSYDAFGPYDASISTNQQLFAWGYASQSSNMSATSLVAAGRVEGNHGGGRGSSDFSVTFDAPSTQSIQIMGSCEGGIQSTGSMSVRLEGPGSIVLFNGLASSGHQIQFNNTLLSGRYTLTMHATASGLSAGNFYGEYNMQASVVPSPTPLAVLFATGLFASRRRR